MKQFIFCLILALLPVSTWAFNCGFGNRSIATNGMHKYQVLKECGSPISAQVVGLQRTIGGVRIVEEWVYVTESYGKRQMYLLKIGADGRVKTIDWLGEVK